MTPAHTKEEFEIFMSQLKETNATLSFYSDFKKISKNVYDIAISLNMLNFLLGKENLRDAVEALWKRDPKAFDVMDILIATRKKDNKKFFDDSGNYRLVHSLFDSVDGIMEFLEGTGLHQSSTFGPVSGESYVEIAKPQFSGQAFTPVCHCCSRITKQPVYRQPVGKTIETPVAALDIYLFLLVHGADQGGHT